MALIMVQWIGYKKRYRVSFKNWENSVITKRARFSHRFSFNAVVTMDHLIGKIMVDTEPPLNHIQRNLTTQLLTHTIGTIQHIKLTQRHGRHHHHRKHQPNPMEIECHNHAARETVATTSIRCVVRITLPEVVMARYIKLFPKV